MSYLEILEKTSAVNVIIDAVYYIMRLIKHRNKLDDKCKDYIAYGSKNEPSSNAQKIAREVITEIERIERCGIHCLNDEKANKYTTELHQFIKQRLSKHYNAVDDKQGTILLNHLRNSSQYINRYQEVLRGLLEAYEQLDKKLSEHREQLTGFVNAEEFTKQLDKKVSEHREQLDKKVSELKAKWMHNRDKRRKYAMLSERRVVDLKECISQIIHIAAPELSERTVANLKERLATINKNL
jgi:flagellar biosynthesis chaperone FliJ